MQCYHFHNGTMKILMLNHLFEWKKENNIK